MLKIVPGSVIPVQPYTSHRYWPIRLPPFTPVENDWIKPVNWISNPCQNFEENIMDYKVIFFSPASAFGISPEAVGGKISILGRTDLKPHCDSGYTLSAIYRCLFRITQAETFLTALSKEILPPSLCSYRYCDPLCSFTEMLHSHTFIEKLHLASRTTK